MVPRLSAAMAARSMIFMISLLWGSGLGPRSLASHRQRWRGDGLAPLRDNRPLGHMIYALNRENGVMLFIDMRFAGERTMRPRTSPTPRPPRSCADEGRPTDAALDRPHGLPGARACRHAKNADLAALIAAGKGDVPFITMEPAFAGRPRARRHSHRIRTT